MAKLKTLLLLVLATFILVACGDGRGDDKAKLKVSLLEELGDIENADKIADCQVDAFSDAMDDDAWAAMMTMSDGGDESVMAKYIEDNELDGEAIMKQVMAGAAASLLCLTED